MTEWLYTTIRRDFALVLLESQGSRFILARTVAKELRKRGYEEAAPFHVSRFAKELGVTTFPYRKQMALAVSDTETITRWADNPPPLPTPYKRPKQPVVPSMEELVSRGYLRTDLALVKYLNSVDGDWVLVSDAAGAMEAPEFVVETAAAAVGSEIWSTPWKGDWIMRRTIRINHRGLRDFVRAAKPYRKAPS